MVHGSLSGFDTVSYSLLKLFWLGLSLGFLGSVVLSPADDFFAVLVEFELGEDAVRGVDGEVDFLEVSLVLLALVEVEDLPLTLDVFDLGALALE
eukprot:CAMPEP_0116934734 /NCGR_PEP_ID=MMETSP0467-20121206/29844_1 /TAXON_ID=283647 /ORGANISM="Mesodinium pulex, Strain SPMC105" /LENGTH=94 /DNA_ID=CAMNT_0004615933 /DNA_START=122 /DNA_END=406 /DNA_ORIENTATION=+